MVDEAPNRTQIYNIVTVVMLVLTTVVGCFVLVRFLSENPFQTQPVAEPTLFVLASLTPTLPPPTVPPTSTITPTFTPSPTRPVPMTNTPSQTLTPTSTEMPTGTLEPTATETPEASATPTLSPFDYVLQNDAVTYTSNFANSAECDWAGLAGQVFDIDGKPELGLRIRVTGGGVDEIIISGSNTAYGASGWERMVDNEPNEGTFYVQLQDAVGNFLSDVIIVQMIPTCSNNLALVNFVQVNP